MKAAVCIPTPVDEVRRCEPMEMTPSLAWTATQNTSFCYMHPEMNFHGVIGPWTFWPHHCVFYWWGCKLLWYCQLIETVEGRISLLEHNHWSWALEECIISSDPRFLAPCHWFPAGKMWTVFCHHTLLAMVFCLLESKTVISSTHDYELKSAKLLVKTYTSSFLVAFLIFYCSDRKMTHADGERSEDRFFLPYEWYSKKKCIRFLCLFLLTI